MKKKKLNDLDKYVIFSFVCIIIYTIGAYLAAMKYGVELDVLTSLFFSVFGGEVLLCALIKKLKLKQSNKKEEEKDAVG